MTAHTPKNRSVRSDASLKVWRLEKRGALMAGFSDAIISISPRDCPKHALMMAVLNILGDQADSLAVVPASTTTLGHTVITIYPRGEPADTTPDSCVAAMKLLKGLHSIETTHSPHILTNRLLVEGRYCTQTTWDALFAHKVSMLAAKFRDTAIDMFERSRERFDRSAVAGLKGCLVHGDVQFGNMIRSRGKLRLIDWEDARIDHPLMDVAQFLFVNAIPKPKVREVMRAYDPTLTAEDVLLFGYLNYLWTCLFMREYEDLMQAARTWSAEHALPETLNELSTSQKSIRDFTP